MRFHKKVVVVTGGGNGIGAALCARFAREGAAVVVADVDSDRAKAVAEQVSGLAVPCDVGKEDDVLGLVSQTEASVGPVDLFFSNAGVASMGGIEVPDADWQRMWQVNVMAHVYAARAVIPGMVRRGGGCLVQTASAAGLLNHVDSAPYAVTKHAAVALAESLAIEYGDRGIQVSVVCPGAVRTEMIRDMSAGGAEADGVLEPDEAAKRILDGLLRGEFLILTHEVVRTYVQRKAADYDRWIAGMRGLRDRLSASRTGSA